MLLSKLKKKPICNNFHLILFSVILLLLGLKYKFILIFLILYLIFILKRFKKYFFSLIIITIFIFLEITIINCFKEPENNIVAKIDKIENNGYIVNYNLYKIKIIDYDKDYKPGDIINLDLRYEEIEEKSYEADFDYKEYLKSNKILYLAKANNSYKLKSGFSLNLLKYYFMNYLNNKIDNDSFDYIKAIVLSENDLNKDLKNGYSLLGISHILAISGMHIILLFNIISFLLKKIFRYYKNLIPLIIISIYVISIGSPPSALRALLFLIIGALNEKGEIKYTKLDILSISFLLMIISWPYLFYNIGFILSFFVSFILIFSNEIIKSKSKLKSLYLTYFLIYFLTLPIISSFNNQISFLRLLISPILSFALGIIIILLSYLISIIPALDLVFCYVFKFINNYVINITKYNLKITIPSFNIYMMIIYYVFIFLLIRAIILNKNKIRFLIMFLLILLSFINLRLANFKTKITFIDVGQGDSCLIELPFNNGVILIDSYNSIDFIKSEGISRIDYLILTHGDEDHCLEAIDVINYFNVKNIILNNGEYNEKEAKIIKRADELNINHINKIEELKIDKYIFYFLNTRLYDNENDNSNVIYTNIDGIDLLFMGDAEKDKEYDIINKYKLNEIDILKVGHHGSKTSSTKEFIDYIKPKIGIISVKKNNKYNHPDKEALDNLKNTKLYMTKDSGNITLFIFNGKYYIKTYK